MSFGLFRPSRLPWYMVCIDVMPPIPVPCVLATIAGCTQRMSSAGVNPGAEERIDRRHDVPHRHPVQRVVHVLR